ncbi:MAG: hypothetical protein ABW277_15145 [Longimicrobiaceae bacterium]
MRHARIAPPLGALLLAAACAGVSPAPPPAVPAPVPPSAPAPPPPAPMEPPPRAPWVGPPLPAASVPAVYAAEWRKAANRAACAPLAPASLGAYAAARPRAATFSGGWAVAYDLPERRSAFGIAGAGVSAEGPSYTGWPHRIRWSDGSVAEYGPEGGTGPNQLAYLRVTGQECLYNVWSALGREHLEQLLAQLRFVRVP